MTPKRSIGKRTAEIDWRNFEKAAAVAREGGAQTAMITGKGEPTLYPEQVTDYLRALAPYKFPFVELQTNALLFDLKRERYEPLLRSWYELGLTTISISIVHVDPEANRSIYVPHRSSYIDLPGVIRLLQEIGFTVRLSVVLVRGFIDTVQKLEQLITIASGWGVDQISCRPVSAPTKSEDAEAYRWTAEHLLSPPVVQEMLNFLDEGGARLQVLPHGAVVFDYRGQNVCLTNCLTIQPEAEQIRQLIFFPSGTIAYDWQHKGATLLRGKFDRREQIVSAPHRMLAAHG